MFSIVVERSAKKALSSFDFPVQQQLAEDIHSLSTRFMDGKRLTGELKGSRSFRSGVYRIIYDVDFEREAVRIFRVGHRKDVYKKP